MAQTRHRVLVTGAAGKLGKWVCRALADRGHEVRATDQCFNRELPHGAALGDLLDEHFVYRVLTGCDSVVHLGNHPNRFAGPSAQRLLAENTAMNANVFQAAVDLGVGCIVFASSVQVMLRYAGAAHPTPIPVPYLPLDGAAPPDPGNNPYAQSKEFGERMLELHAAQHPGLSTTALRLPMLPLESWVARMTSERGIERQSLNFAECLSHLLLPDAGDLIARVVEKRLPGYHQYFPAVSAHVRNRSVPELVSEMYASAPLKRPLEQLDALVDASEVWRELDWEPSHRMSVTLLD